VSDQTLPALERAGEWDALAVALASTGCRD
jgi:hypothetical protein